MKTFKLPLLLATVLLAACTPKESQRTVHEGRVGTFDDRNYVTAADAKNSVLTAYARRAEYSKRINESKSVKDALDVALELESIVLSKSVLSEPALSGRSEFDAVLSQFHRALDRAMDLDMKAVVASGLPARYEATVLSHCTSENRGCVRLPLFRGDHLAGRLLMRIAGTLEPELLAARARRNKGENDNQYFTLVTRYYRLLQMAYEMSNSLTNPELDQKYVTFARDYFEYFRALPEEQKQHDFHRRHRDTLTLALGHLRNQSRGGKLNEPYCRFLMDLNPLDTASFSSMDLEKRSQRSMLAEFIECASQKGELKNLISRYVNEEFARGQSVFQEERKAGQERPAREKAKDEGYAYAMAHVREASKIASKLGVEFKTRNDLGFFILDRIFYRQMDLNVAQSYWNRIGQFDDKEFLSFARNYARLQSTYVLKITLENYARIFREQFEAKGGFSSDFFFEVIKELNSTSQFDWDELRDRLLFVREFMIKVYDQRLMRGASDKKAVELQNEYIALKEELGSLSEHFALAVSTPLSVPLYYYMAKAQGTIKFFVPWFPSSDQWFDVPAADALARFLRADTSRTYPFFKFGAINLQLDAYQKLHVLDFAFRIGVFDYLDFAMLPEDKETGLSAPSLFFKQAAKDILTTFERTFRTEIERLENIATQRSFATNFLGACEDPMRIPVTFGLREFTMGTLLNDPALVDPVGPIYSASNSIFAWRMNRDNVEQLIKILKTHLDLSRPQDKAIMDQVNSEIERYNNMERELFARMMNLDRQIVNEKRDCLARLHRAEFLRRNALMDANIEYYKDVHAAMTVVRELGGDYRGSSSEAIALFAQKSQIAPDVVTRGQKLLAQASALMGSQSLEEALNAVLRVHNDNEANYGIYVTGVPTLKESGRALKSINRFNGELFQQGRWDAIMRTRHYLQTLTVNAADVNVLLGTAYRGITPLGQNTNIPLGSFGELDGNSFYLDNSEKSVKYVADQRAFVNAAMIQFGGAEPNGTQYFSWFSQGGLSIGHAEKRLNWLKTLQELGTIEIADSDRLNCPVDIWGRPMAVRDFSGRWLPGAPHAENCKAIRVSAQDVMDAYLTVVDLLRVSDKERELLSVIDRRGKLEDRIKRYFTYNNEPSTSKWTYFDQFYRTNYTTITAVSNDGAVWKAVQLESIRGRQEFTQFKDSYLRNVENAPALFALRKTPTQIARDQIREKFVKHLDDIMAFEETVYNLENRHKAEGTTLGDFLVERTTTKRADEEHVFGDWRVVKVKTRRSSDRERDNTPIYLSEENSAKAWFEGFVEAFAIKDTDCMILPMEGDPDFKGENVSQMSCRQRYEKWKAGRDAERSQLRRLLEVSRNGG